jgi:hypothetical protein
VLCAPPWQPPFGSMMQPASAQRVVSRLQKVVSPADEWTRSSTGEFGAAEAAQGARSEAASSREARFRRGRGIEGLLRGDSHGAATLGRAGVSPWEYGVRRVTSRCLSLPRAARPGAAFRVIGSRSTFRREGPDALEGGSRDGTASLTAPTFSLFEDAVLREETLATLIAARKRRRPRSLRARLFHPELFGGRGKIPRQPVRFPQVGPASYWDRKKLQVLIYRDASAIMREIVGDYGCGVRRLEGKSRRRLCVENEGFSTGFSTLGAVARPPGDDLAEECCPVLA